MASPLNTKAPAPKKNPKRYLDLSAAFPVGGTIARPKFAKYVDKTGVLDAPVTLANANSQKATPDAVYDRVVMHWTAGGPLLPYDDYHFCQVMDTDGEPAIIRCIKKGYKGQHLHKRNTHAAGFSWCAPGPGAVGAIRLEQMAKLVAEFCFKHKLDPAGKTHDGFDVISDHAAYAVVDYPGHRWDVGGQLPAKDPRNLLAPLRKKAIWYHSQIKTLADCEFAEIL